jgi:hypothetical protein
MGTETLIVTSLGGSTLHGVLCDAFMSQAGFVPFEGVLYEILTMTPCTVRAGAFVWVTRRARYAGAA